MDQLLLAIALRLAPYDPPARITTRVQVIARAAQPQVELEPTRDEVELGLVLLVIDFHETTIGRRGVAFGTTSCRACTDPASRAAWALGVWRESLRQCGSRLSLRFGFFHTGRCRPDNFARREARMFRAEHRRLFNTEYRP